MTTTTTKRKPLFTPRQRGGLPLSRCRQLLNDVLAAGPEAMRRFDKAIGSGSQVQYAAMFALKKSPGTLGTDRAFMEGRLNNQQLDSMSPWWRRHILSEARRAGIDINGKVWNGTIGRASDPRAWVGSVDDVRQAAKAKGAGMEGMVNMPAPDLPPPKPVKLDESIVREVMQERLEADPSLRARVRRNKTAREDLRRDIIAKHGNPNVKDE